MKKRYIILGLLALELITLPASAHILHKKGFSFDTSAFVKPQRAISVKLNSRPGQTRFMLTANAPFSVTSKDAIGTLNIEIDQAGTVNGNPFGQNTQSPGLPKNCASVASPIQQIIYASERGTTSENKGDVLTKTILVTINYDPAITPDIQILTQKKSEFLLTASSCSQTNSI